MSAADLVLRLKAEGASHVASEAHKVDAATGKLEDTATGASGKLAGLGKAMIAAFSVAAVKQVLDFGAAMFKVGMESQAFGRKFEAVFGDNETLLAWADAHHQAFGVAADEVQGYLAQVGNLLTGMGLTADEAGSQATEVLELAGAWSAWSGGVISVSDAADKLTRGMMGQTRGLMELGLKVTEEEVAARLAAEGLDKLSGAEASRAQQQIMWQLIQEKSTTAVGAYGEAMGGAYGASMKLATAVDEIKDSIGAMVVAAAPAIAVLADLMMLATGSTPQMDWSSGEMTAQVEAQMAQLDAIETRVRRLGGTYTESTFALDWWNRSMSEGNRTAANSFAEIVWAEAATTLATQEWEAGLLDANGNVIASTGQLAAAQRPVADAYAYTAVQAMALYAAEQALANQRLAALDPVFAAIQAEQGLAEATAEVTRLEGVGATGTDEYRLALLNQLAAQAKLDAAHGSLLENETQARLSIVELGDALGFTADQTATLIGFVETFNTTDVDPGGSLEAQILALRDALGLTESEARDLLIALGLLPASLGPGGYYSGGGYGTPEARASGGGVMADQPYIVGEHGPELFISSSKGTIIPNYQMASTAPVTMPTSGGVSVSAPTTVIVQGSVWALDDLAAEIEARLVRSAQRGGSSLLLAGG